MGSRPTLGDKFFLRLLFLDAHRDVSSLTGELPEESAQLRFIRAVCLANLKVSWGKSHDMVR